MTGVKKTARAMCAKHSDIMPQGEDEIEPLNATRSGRVHHKIFSISTGNPEIQKQEESSEVTKAKALKYLQNNYPSELWCHVYTEAQLRMQPEMEAQEFTSNIHTQHPHHTLLL